VIFLHKSVIDITGQKFGRLTALSYLGGGYWDCVCDCDPEKHLRVNGYSLRKGFSQSCGCLRKERLHEALFIDLTGQTFGEWYVESYAGYEKRASWWNIVCSCGTRKKLTTQALRDGISKSCGCKKSQYVSESEITHNMSRTRFYRIWQDMKNRCNNESNCEYHNYGGRGIKVCEEWNNSFIAFRDAMYDEYQEHVDEYGENDTSLDRIDYNGNYCKENCRWATCHEQILNRRTSLRVEFDGKIDLVWDLAERYDKRYDLVARRLRDGWNIYEALEIVPRKTKKRNGIEMFELDGVKKPISYWCKLYNIGRHTVRRRLHNGMSFREALETPKGTRISSGIS